MAKNTRIKIKQNPKATGADSTDANKHRTKIIYSNGEMKFIKIKNPNEPIKHELGG